MYCRSREVVAYRLQQEFVPLSADGGIAVVRGLDDVDTLRATAIPTASACQHEGNDCNYPDNTAGFREPSSQ